MFDWLLFITKVAGAAVIFEVQRSAKSEARKEEMRRQEIEVIILAFILLFLWISIQ